MEDLLFLNCYLDHLDFSKLILQFERDDLDDE